MINFSLSNFTNYLSSTYKLGLNKTILRLFWYICFFPLNVFKTMSFTFKKSKKYSVTTLKSDLNTNDKHF